MDTLHLAVRSRSLAPTHRQVFQIAWPIILANCAVPLLGLADTAVIGRTGTVVDLGAVALGALIFNFVYWSFGFLRMGTTGFTAQAAGAGDEPEVRATLGRALLLAAAIGVGLIVLKRPIAWLALDLLGASKEVEETARSYVLIRIWGAPASLGTFAVMGTLVGLGSSRPLLAVQLVLNGTNIALDVLFAGVLGWGASGIALGTALADWTALLFGLSLVNRLLRSRRRDGEPHWPWARIRDAARLARTLVANGDIMLRTLTLTFGFAWFTNQGARFGDAFLAANHVLLQFVAVSAYLLDGYAFAAEALVGQAIGAGRRQAFDRAVRRSSDLAGTTAVVLAAGILLIGRTAIDGLTRLESVRGIAERYLPYAALYVLVSFAAFQLDGIFIGATRTRDMRNAGVLSVLAFLACCWPLARWAGNGGLWAAFILFVIARAAALGARYPALRRAIADRAEAGSRMAEMGETG